MIQINAYRKALKYKIPDETIIRNLLIQYLACGPQGWSLAAWGQKTYQN